jgi:hypothetical protein
MSRIRVTSTSFEGKLAASNNATAAVEGNGPEELGVMAATVVVDTNVQVRTVVAENDFVGEVQVQLVVATAVTDGQIRLIVANAETTNGCLAQQAKADPRQRDSSD